MGEKNKFSTLNKRKIEKKQKKNLTLNTKIEENDTHLIFFFNTKREKKNRKIFHPKQNQILNFEKKQFSIKKKPTF